EPVHQSRRRTAGRDGTGRDGLGRADRPGGRRGPDLRVRRARRPGRSRHAVPRRFRLMPGMAPGRYRMTVVCGGDGKGIVTLTMGGESATATARCGTTPEGIAAGAATVAMERVGSENVSVEVGYSSDDAPEQSHVVLMALEFIG